MVNWSNYKTSLFSIFLLCILCSIVPLNNNSKKWGFYGHREINKHAVFTLTPELFGFYKEHIEYLTEHSVVPDKRRYSDPLEGACHYIDLDHFTIHYMLPFDSITIPWEKAVNKFSEDTLRKYGIIPWHISLLKFKLQKAFEEKNAEQILFYSAEIGHYIADAHVPLHTTENYNGQLTGQNGIHALWESRLVELFSQKYSFFTGKCKYISSISKEIWTTIKISHLALDSVLQLEKQVSNQMSPDQKFSFEQRGNSTVRVYSKEFSNAYHTALNGMVERRMKAAILSIGSVWYSAWVDAGQPNLNSLHYKKSNDKETEVFNDSIKEHENHNTNHWFCD